MDVYTRIAKAARVNREEVKRVLYAAAYDGALAHDAFFESLGGGSSVGIALVSPGMVTLDINEGGVAITRGLHISIRALAAVLAKAHEDGFQKVIDEYTDAVSLTRFNAFEP